MSAAPDDAEELYRQWCEEVGDPELEESGRTPWFGSDDERRELWMRRYQRPQPPEGLTIPTIINERAA